MPQKIEISLRTIVFAFLIYIGFQLVAQITDIILIVFMGLLIMAILNPLVTNLARYRFPRPLSVLLVYILVIGALTTSFSLLVPPLVSQTTTFVNHFPDYVENVGLPNIYSAQIGDQLLSQLGAIPGRAAQITLSLFSNILEIVTILVFAFYLLMMREHLNEHLAPFFDDRKKKEIARVIDILEHRLGGWARGQLLLMVAVGSVTYVGLRILDIPYALPLAIFAGFFELVPYIGPFIAAVPAVIIGFSISPFLGFAAASLAFLIQQLENYVFVPKIMQRSAGVNPIVTLIALAIGFQLAGITGLLISVPCAITLEVLAKEYYFSKKEKTTS